MGFTRRHLTIAFGGAVLVWAAVQLTGLLGARLEVGDTFAPYSTLRADPLGLMAVYNALDALPAHSTLRYVRPFEELPDGRDSTLVVAGAGLGMDPLPILEALENFIETGGRAVVAFHPMDDAFELEQLQRTMRARDRARLRKAARSNPDDSTSPADDGEAVETDVKPPSEDAPGQAADSAADTKSAADTETAADDDAAPEDKEDVEEDVKEEDADAYPMSTNELLAEDISERWGFDYGFGLPRGDSVATRDSEELPVELELRIRSGLHFKASDDAWTPIYTRPGEDEDDAPLSVVMERSYGSGSIVLCSDTYFLSNEALRNDRAPALIQWAMGDNVTLLFSETHLGQGQRDRLMTLVRRYRLHGVLAALILVGGLFIWKNGTTLIPRGERQLAARTEEERSQQIGLDNLLSRYVAPGAVMDLCVAEWLQHFAKTPAAPTVERARPAGGGAAGPGTQEERAVAEYNAIARELQKRKF